MKQAEKLQNLKILLGITDDSEDSQLGVYLKMAEDEILNWLYSASSTDHDGVEMPQKYEWVQINACIAGFNLNGAENQTSHNENGISRTFKYSDMLAYVHAHVYPYVGLPGVSEE